MYYTGENKDHDKDKDEYNDHYWDDHKDKDHDRKDCVEEILAAILKAQRKVEDSHKKCHSCKDPIKDLMDEPKKTKKNTIPFILYCGCEPFKGTGVTTFPSRSKQERFACISSFIFRISDLNGQCAELELLAFKPKRGEPKKICSPCDQIDCEHVDDLVRTGICITVDLSCFCAVTCLPAVRL